MVLWGLLAAFWVGHIVTGGLLKFPTDFDSLNYHLPLINQWLHAQSLYAPDCWHWSYPGNNELVGLWLVAPFSGDFLIGLNNLPASVLLACGTVGLGRELGLTRAFAHLTGFAVVSNFVVLNQLTDTENDVATAGLFLTCLMYGFRYVRQGQQGDLLFCGISLGLLTGVKFYTLGYAVLAGLCIVLLTLHSRGLRRSALAAAVLLLGIVLFGGYWYVRNAIVTGMPVYPKSFAPEQDLLTRIYPDVAHTSFLGNGRPELLGFFVSAVWRMTGPCQLAAFFLLPLSLGWLLLGGAWGALVKKDAQCVRVRLTPGLLLVGSGILLLITPFAVEDSPGTLNQMHWHYCPVRYGLCFLSLAMLGAVLMLEETLNLLHRRDEMGSSPRNGLREQAGRWLRYLAHVVLASGVVCQLFWPDRRLSVNWAEGLLIAANIAQAGVLFILICVLWPRARRILPAAMILAALTISPWVSHALASRWHAGFAPHFDRLISNTFFTHLEKDGAGPAKICVLEVRSYPFFGSRRQFAVCQPIYVWSPEWLVDYLRKENVSVVAARFRRSRAAFQTFLWFDEVYASHAGAFRVIAPRSQGSSLLLFRFQCIEEPQNHRRSVSVKCQRRDSSICFRLFLDLAGEWDKIPDSAITKKSFTLHFVNSGPDSPVSPRPIFFAGMLSSANRPDLV